MDSIFGSRKKKQHGPAPGAGAGSKAKAAKGGRGSASPSQAKQRKVAKLEKMGVVKVPKKRRPGPQAEDAEGAGVGHANRKRKQRPERDEPSDLDEEAAGAHAPQEEEEEEDPAEEAEHRAALQKAVAEAQRAIKTGRNVYFELFSGVQAAMPEDMAQVFDPELPQERREELLSLIDPDLPAAHSWAVPDERALRILEHFAPVVEVGAGLGYWGGLLLARKVKYSGFDSNVNPAAKHIRKGGPEVLSKFADHTLFLCYPDDRSQEESLSLKCLEQFQGDTIIHVGELFGETVLENPWGKSTNQEFQEQLAASFHKILQVPLPSWQGARDSLSVWRRTEACEWEDITFKHIPEDEQLPLTTAAPCVFHLLQQTGSPSRDEEEEEVDAEDAGDGDEANGDRGRVGRGGSSTSKGGKAEAPIHRAEPSKSLSRLQGAAGKKGAKLPATQPAEGKAKHSAKKQKAAPAPTKGQDTSSRSGVRSKPTATGKKGAAPEPSAAAQPKHSVAMQFKPDDDWDAAS